MHLPQWIGRGGRRSYKSKQLLAARRRRDSKRLGFETLEDRSLLATLYVDNTPTLVGPGADEFTASGGTQINTSGLTLGTNLFTTIQAAVTAANNLDTINVSDGTYNEGVTIVAGLTLRGNQAGGNANTRFAAFTVGDDGPKANPAVETVLTAVNNNPTGGNPNAEDLIRVLSNNVTIDGLVLDGNNPGLVASATTINGVNIHARRGITNVNAANNVVPVNNLLVQNNVLQNFGQRAVSLSGAAALTGNSITANVVRNFREQGILLLTNAYADITNNTIGVPNDAIGLHLQNFSSNGSMTWSGNNITVGQDAFGIHANLFYAPAGVLNITGNNVNAAAGVTGASDFTWGINVWSVQVGSTVNLTSNNIGSAGGQFARGINLWNLPTTDFVSISGGSVGNSVVGINLDSIDPFFGAGANTEVDITGVSVTADIGIRVRNEALSSLPGFNVPAGNVRANISGGSVTATSTGLLVKDAAVADLFSASARLLGGTSINNGVTGLQIDGPETAIIGNALSNTAFSGQSGNYISLANTALDNQVLDARDVTFDGTSPEAMTSAQLVALENKIFHEVDVASLGLVLTLDTTPGTVTQDGTTLIISGTGDKDHIEIKSKNGALQVSVRSKTFDFDGVFTGITKIVVYGYAGDDHLKLHKEVTTRAFLFGGFGKDHLEAGSGNTVLVGGAGDDDLKGGSGRNILIGGTGGDMLEGKDGADILIGGTTSYDDHLAALDAILAEWESSLTASLLTTSSVFDDGVSDDLKGGKGQDRFYADTNNPDKKKRDKMNDFAAGEVLIEL